MLIDMHAHVIPGEFPEAGCGPGTEGWPTMTPTGSSGARLLEAGDLRFTAQAAFFDAGRRLAAMDASGTDAEVVSPMPPLLNYQLPAASGRDLARWINEFIGRMCEAEPGRFFGLGSAPLQDPDLAAAELSGLADCGLSGVEIGSHVNGVSLGDERFAGFFAEAGRLRIPVFVHAFSPALGQAPRQRRGHVRIRHRDRPGRGLDHHQPDPGGVPGPAAGLQPWGGRISADADPGAVLLERHVERGTARPRAGG